MPGNRIGRRFSSPRATLFLAVLSVSRLRGLVYFRSASDRPFFGDGSLRGAETEISGIRVNVRENDATQRPFVTRKRVLKARSLVKSAVIALRSLTVHTKLSILMIEIRAYVPNVVSRLKLKTQVER